MNEATERYLAISKALLLEAGVTEHKVIVGRLTGCAYKDGRIEAPQGRTRKQLYILAHECAHVALRHGRRDKPVHVREVEAEKWAHAALRRYGVAVPRAMTVRAKRYVGRKIKRACARGAKRIDPAAQAYARF